MPQYDFVVIKTNCPRSEFRGGFLIPNDEMYPQETIDPDKAIDFMQDIIDDLNRQIAVYKRRIELVKMYGASAVLEAASMLEWFPNRAEEGDKAMMNIWNEEEQ